MTQTIAIVYALIAVITVVAAYVYGYTVAQRKHRGYVKGMQEALDIALQKVDEWESKYSTIQKEALDIMKLITMYIGQRDEWQKKYTALQQEIECHQHEVHEEIERPHIQVPDNELTRWAAEYYASDRYKQNLARGYQEYVEYTEQQMIQDIYGERQEWEPESRECIDDIHD